MRFLLPFILLTSSLWALDAITDAKVALLEKELTELKPTILQPVIQKLVGLSYEQCYRRLSKLAHGCPLTLGTEFAKCLLKELDALEALRKEHWAEETLQLLLNNTICAGMTEKQVIYVMGFPDEVHFPDNGLEQWLFIASAWQTVGWGDDHKPINKEVRTIRLTLYFSHGLMVELPGDAGTKALRHLQTLRFNRSL